MLGRGDSILAPGLRYDVVRFRGEPGEPLTLALESSDFEGVLEWGRVLNGAWQTLESNDQARSQTITVTVADTSEYRIRVRARHSGSRGDSTLTASPGPQRVTSAEPVVGRLGPADTRLTEGVWYEEWELRLLPGRTDHLTVHADTFAARIEWGRLAGDRWERLEEATAEGPGQGRAAHRHTVGHERVPDPRAQPPRTLRRTLHAAPFQRAARASAGIATAGLTAEQRRCRLHRPRDRRGVGLPRPRRRAGHALSVRSSTVRSTLEWGRFTDGRWQSFASTSDSSLRVRPPATGEYFVRVTGGRPDESARYRLLRHRRPSDRRRGRTGYGHPGYARYG